MLNAGQWFVDSYAMKENILENLRSVRRRITNACMEQGRNPTEVRLLLATKTVPAEKIRIALEAGETLIGENKVQELKLKWEALQNIPHQAHFIGHLQRNKVKEVLQYASCIQSLDSLKLVLKLDQRLQFEGRSVEVLLQINTSYEESKYGVHPDDAIRFAQEVAKYDTLKIKGLMTIGLFSAQSERVRKCFQLLKTVKQKIEALGLSNVAMDELSMGMSGDLETAIAEGATMVRVGTAIFGERPYPDSYYWNENRV